MKNNHYQFISRWKVKGIINDVARLLNQPENLPLWWPSVYLSVEKTKLNGYAAYYMYTKGWLPYTIRWQLVKTLDEFPHRFDIQAVGDLEGYGKWLLKQDGDLVSVTYHWTVTANKPLFRYFSFLLKPLFSFNHKWAMKMGEQSLQMELDRLVKGLSRTEAPVPPLPTYPHRNYYKSNLEFAKLQSICTFMLPIIH